MPPYKKNYFAYLLLTLLIFLTFLPLKLNRIIRKNKTLLYLEITPKYPKRLMSKAIDIVLKLGVTIVLIIGAAATQQYSYYSFLRWVVMATSIYFIYKSYTRNHIGLLIFFSTIAILFNPFKPFHFQRETWHLIDYIVCAIILVTIYFDWEQYKLNKA
jgi:uncharacterized membrane protein YbhN (UPF0104 family)